MRWQTRGHTVFLAFSAVPELTLRCVRDLLRLSWVTVCRLLAYIFCVAGRRVLAHHISDHVGASRDCRFVILMLRPMQNAPARQKSAQLGYRN
jgi:hypothetical protein